MTKRRTHAGKALAAALVIPCASEAWLLCTYDYFSADGTPDNALIHSLPFMAIFASVLSCVALIGFQAFGKYLLGQSAPSIASPMVFAALAALPVPAWMFWAMSGWSDPPPSTGATAGFVWVFLFVSSVPGALTQWVLIGRDRITSAADGSPSAC